MAVFLYLTIKPQALNFGGEPQIDIIASLLLTTDFIALQALSAT